MHTSTQSSDALLAALRILVVEDDLASRKVIGALLSAIGVETVYEAASGIEGLEAIRLRQPDLVLLDWEMPGMDGAEFMRRLHEPGRFRSSAVPIIMLIGNGETWRIIEAMDLGVCEFIVKPVSTAALRMRVVSVMTHPRLARCQVRHEQAAEKIEVGRDALPDESRRTVVSVG